MTDDLFMCLGWGSPVERERRRRILVTVWAYAYEIHAKPLVDDAMFDRVANEIDLTINTGRLDEWFRENFTPSSGMWIHSHPEIDRVKAMYHRVVQRRNQTPSR